MISDNETIMPPSDATKCPECGGTGVPLNLAAQWLEHCPVCLGWGLVGPRFPLQGNHIPQHSGSYVHDIQRELTAAQSQLSTLRAALASSNERLAACVDYLKCYGDHDAPCPMNSYSRRSGVCTCGFEAALAAATKKENP